MVPRMVWSGLLMLAAMASAFAPRPSPLATLSVARVRRRPSCRLYMSDDEPNFQRFDKAKLVQHKPKERHART